MNLSGPQAERDGLWQMGRKDERSKRKEDLSLSYPHSEKLVKQ